MKNKKLVVNRIDKETFVSVCQSSESMAKAASELKLHFNSFKKRAIELNCYYPNQSGRGVGKQVPKIPLHEIIILGQHPHYQTYKLKNRLIDEAIKEFHCENCGLIEWLGKPIKLELHHIDGNRTNHLLSNLMLICPNCHSQTETFRAKNRKFECLGGNPKRRTSQSRGNLEIGNPEPSFEIFSKKV